MITKRSAGLDGNAAIARDIGALIAERDELQRRALGADGRALRAEAQVVSLIAERNALAAKVAAVEALVEKWRYKGEFGWGPWQEGHGPDQEGYVLDQCATDLRAALRGCRWRGEGQP